jgi:hypothetical protein
MARIPGLAKHCTVKAVAPIPNRERAYELLKEAVRMLADLYPEQALVWLRECRPDVVAWLKECEAAVDAAVLSGDLMETKRMLTKYVTAHQRAFGLFTHRGPAVDAQGEFFHV